MIGLFCDMQYSSWGIIMFYSSWALMVKLSDLANCSTTECRLWGPVPYSGSVLASFASQLSLYGYWQQLSTADRLDGPHVQSVACITSGTFNSLTVLVFKRSYIVLELVRNIYALANQSGIEFQYGLAFFDLERYSLFIWNDYEQGIRARNINSGRKIILFIIFYNIDLMQRIAQQIQSVLPHNRIDVFGKNQLLHSTIPYYLLPFIIVIAILGNIDIGILFIFFTYSLLPLFDQLFSLDLVNPTQQDRKQLQKENFMFKLPIYITVGLDWILFFKAMNIISQTQFSGFNAVKLLAYVFAFSNLNAIQVGVAHQIFHKQEKFDKYIGTLHLLKNLYLHFTYQHVYNHHRTVGTPQDPASAEKNQSLYNFFPKVFLRTYKSVYKMEQKQKKSFFTNYAVISVIAQLVFTAFIFRFYGVQGGIFFLLEAFGSVYFIQATNYIEHYGLRRFKSAEGKYEKISIYHSWNAPHRFSNYLFFKIQRHSDHHQNSLKPYQTLVALQQSPRFPHGYSVCIFMAFFPTLWFKVMNPLVQLYNANNRDKEKYSQKEKVQIIATALKQTRIFIIKMSIIVTSFFIFFKFLI